MSSLQLSELPTAEDDHFEFKSSLTSHKELKEKLSCAVSGFSNSGGGHFAIGVDASGNADGGIAMKVGRQDLRDWIDQAIQQVEPTPIYQIALLEDSQGRGSLRQNHCVAIISVPESAHGPHMAHDHRFYIRAGAHTVKARRFIVDAIWSKRHFQKPRICHVFRDKPQDEGVIQLGVVALTSAPALDVEIHLEPLGELLRGSSQYFPLRIPIVDSLHPFYFDVTTDFQAEDRFGTDVIVTVHYRDLASNRYTYAAPAAISSAIPPLRIGGNWFAKAAKAVESIDQQLKKVLRHNS